MSTSAFFTADGCRLVYEDTGQGIPVLWQHGLGADRNQPAEVFPLMSGIRRITLECRGHGGSDLGDPEALSIEQFASDAIVLLDRLGVRAAVLGGISLGAAVTMRMAVLNPQRSLGLVLARPAWVAGVAPAGLALYLEVAKLLEHYGPVKGALRFEASEALRKMEAISPDNAASLRGFFQRDPTSTIALLSRIPLQGPGVSIGCIQQIGCPSLVLANGDDVAHPIGVARTLHSLIHSSQWRVITSKSQSREAYVHDFRRTLLTYLEGVRGSHTARALTRRSRAKGATGD